MVAGVVRRLFDGREVGLRMECRIRERKGNWSNQLFCASRTKMNVYGVVEGVVGWWQWIGDSRQAFVGL
jgi:hypothetical protein